MSAISTTGARIGRLGNAHPLRGRQLRLIEALNPQRSSQRLCLETSIIFISGQYNARIKFLRPTPAAHGCHRANLRIMDRRAKYLGLYIADDKHNAAVAAHGAGNAGLIASIDAYRPVLQPDGPIPANPIL